MCVTIVELSPQSQRFYSLCDEDFHQGLADWQGWDFGVRLLLRGTYPELLFKWRGPEVDAQHQSDEQYGSVIGTDNPDLTAFRDHGGETLIWHGVGR